MIGQTKTSRVAAPRRLVRRKIKACAHSELAGLEAAMAQD